LTQKNVTTLYHPPYSRFISTRLFSVPQVENENKRTQLLWMLLNSKKPFTDELKKVREEEFLADFQKLYDCAKACIYANGAYFEF
jgi:hypothetical protein